MPDVRYKKVISRSKSNSFKVVINFEATTNREQDAPTTFKTIVLKIDVV